MVAVHRQRRGGVGHLHLNALHRPVSDIANGITQHKFEGGRQARQTNGVALFARLTTVGDGSNRFTGFVLQRFSLLQDVELGRTVRDHGRLLDGVGQVAIVVSDVADEERTTGRTVQLHVPNFVDGVKGVSYT